MSQSLSGFHFRLGRAPISPTPYPYKGEERYIGNRWRFEARHVKELPARRESLPSALHLHRHASRDSLFH